MQTEWDCVFGSPEVWISRRQQRLRRHECLDISMSSNINPWDGDPFIEIDQWDGEEMVLTYINPETMEVLQ